MVKAEDSLEGRTQQVRGAHLPWAWEEQQQKHPAGWAGLAGQPASRRAARVPEPLTLLVG